MLPDTTIAIFVVTICLLGIGGALLVHFRLADPIKAVPGGWKTVRVAMNTGSFPQDVDLPVWRAALQRYRSLTRFALIFGTVAVGALCALTAMAVEVESLAFQGLLWGTLLCLGLLEAGKLDRLGQTLADEETFAELYPSADS